MTIDRAIANAAASIEIEGRQIDEETRQWCRMLLNRELTLEQYIQLVKEKSVAKQE